MLEWHVTPPPGTGTAIQWTPCGPEIVGTSPLRVPCPVESCKAAIGQHCTRLRPRRGRVRRSSHGPRITAAAALADTAPGQPVSA
jgi:hypothetical protein